MVASKRTARDGPRRDGRLEDLPNVGPAVAADLRRLGIGRPQDLRGRDPYALYDALCRRTGLRHDPCLLDTFIAAVRYVGGGPVRPWWSFTAERKRVLAARTRSSPARIRSRAGSASGPPPRSKRKGPEGSSRPSTAADPASLANLGPASRAMLAAAGIRTVAQLAKLGAPAAYARVRAVAPRASLNLLWALEGALTARPWQVVAREDRLRLLLALEEAQQRR